MDINMKDVVLFKKGDWIYIKTGEDDIQQPIGTKLLYDDGTKSLAQYQAEVRNLAVKNSWDRLDDLEMFIDFGLTFAGSQKMTLKEFL